MEKDLLYLLKLQEIEKEEKKLTEIRKNHPGYKGLLELREKASIGQNSYNKMVERLKILDDELKNVSNKTQESLTAIRQLEGRIYGGGLKNLKEVDRLQEKSDEYRSKIVDLEDCAFILLEEQESISNGLTHKEKELHAIKSEFNRQRLKIKDEVDTIKAQLEKMRAEKQAIFSVVPSKLLMQYNKVRIKKIPPVAIVKDGQCTGCRMRISIMLAKEVEGNDGVIYCENCGRILVHFEEEQ